MATVTGLTADYMQDIVDDTVIGGHIDGTGHLILEQHDGSTIDAGSALPTLPTATTTVQGIVELATDLETTTGTDTSRAITPANLKAALDIIRASITALVLNDLADVTITSVATNNVLQYNGSAWVNKDHIDLSAGKQVNVGASGSSAILAVKASATGDDIVSTRVTTDTNDRLLVEANGVISWGSGSGTPDTNLYRNGANNLATDDLLTALGGFYAFAVINSVDSLTVQAFGEAQPKFKVDSSGNIFFGVGGSTATDVKLYRSAANVLKTDDSLIVDIDLTVNGDVTVGDDMTVTGDLAVTNLFTPPHGYLPDPNRLVYNTAGGTFTKASYAGLRAIHVQCYGPGGAGGGSTTGAAGAHGCGSGGGSGGYSQAWLLVGALGTSETITVGTGGTGVSAGTGNNGSAATSFGSLCVANAGSGGAALGTQTDARGAAGGAGATAGTGDSPAQPGRPGTVGSGNAGFGWGGNGGVAPGPEGGAGGGGRASGTSNVSLAGNGGSTPGGGGGGALSNSTGASQAGGAGGDGRCIVTLYY